MKKIITSLALFALVIGFSIPSTNCTKITYIDWVYNGVTYHFPVFTNICQ